MYTRYIAAPTTVNPHLHSKCNQSILKTNYLISFVSALTKCGTLGDSAYSEGMLVRSVSWSVLPANSDPRAMYHSPRLPPLAMGVRLHVARGAGAKRKRRRSRDPSGPESPCPHGQHSSYVIAFLFSSFPLLPTPQPCMFRGCQCTHLAFYTDT